MDEKYILTLSVKYTTSCFPDHFNMLPALYFLLSPHFMYSMRSVQNKVRMINDCLKLIILWDALPCNYMYLSVTGDR